MRTEGEAAAERLLAAVGGDPAQVAREAGKALADLAVRGTGAERAILLRALGSAARLLGDLDAAAQHLERSRSIAGRIGRADLRAHANASLAVVCLFQGGTRRALRLIEAACSQLAGADLARAEVHRASILNRLGRVEESLAGLNRIIPRLRRLGEARWEMMARNNRGLLLAWKGDVWAAERDLLRARELAARLTLTARAAEATHNLGFVATRQGDFPAALRYFDEAEAVFVEHGYPLHHTWPDRAAALLGAGLVDEARPLLEETIRRFEGDGMHTDAAETRLLLAHALLADGDAAAAGSVAGEAVRSLRRQRRPGWVAQGEAMALQARWASGRRPQVTLSRALRLATELDGAGQMVPAGAMRALAIEVAAVVGRPDVVAELTPAVRRMRRSGPVEVRIGSWLATARARIAADDPPGAAAAARAGLALADEYRAGLGALDVRAGVGRHVAALADLGLGLAVASRRAARVFDWVERNRAAALRYPPARPPRDKELAARLAVLRRLASELRAAEAAGTPGAALVRDVRRLQRQVRDETRKVGGSGAENRRASAGEVRAALGDRRLVQIFAYDGRVGAVVVDRDRCRLADVGDLTAVRHAVDEVRLGLFALADAGTAPPGRRAAAASVRAAAGWLDEVLPLAGDGPLVVVPPASLHALAWSVLPSLAARPVSVAPSASLWLRRRTLRHRRPGRVLAAAGPGLGEAAAEVRAVAALYPRSQRFPPTRSRAAEVAGALRGAPVAHLACHGRFRSANPLFSSLELADGPLYVHDLQLVDPPPRVVVLSACDVGLAAPRPGGEVMSLAASLLAMGTRALVASTGAVPDSALTRRVMVALHQGLAAGHGPAAALAAAESRVAGRREGDDLLARSFTCLGAG